MIASLIRYGAHPAPCVLLHFVCVATGEGSRILPMQLFGRWHHEAVEHALGVDGHAAPKGANGLKMTWSATSGKWLETTPAAPDSSDDERSVRRSRSGRRALLETAESRAAVNTTSAQRGRHPGRPLLALEDATLDSPLAPRPWAELNALQLLLGGLAELSSRSLVLPALDCHDPAAEFLEPGTLPNRCFWHVHASKGIACVFRVAKCADTLELVSPTELELEMHRVRRETGDGPPVVRLDARASSETVRAAVDKALLGRFASSPIVLVRLTLPSAPAAAATSTDPSVALNRQVHGVIKERHPELARAMLVFAKKCPELTDRSKKRKRECTNVC